MTKTKTSLARSASMLVTHKFDSSSYLSLRPITTKYPGAFKNTTSAKSDERAEVKVKAKK